MIAMDWAALGLGIATGVFMSVVFFAGLAFGMQRALRAEHTIQTLFLSAALRIALFLGAGWLVVTQAGPWAFAGYGLAFFVCRRIAMAMASVPKPAGSAQ